MVEDVDTDVLGACMILFVVSCPLWKDRILMWSEISIETKGLHWDVQPLSAT